MSFFSIAAVLTVICILVLIIPFLRPRPLRMDTQNMNAAILQEHIKELKQDLNEDTITQEQFESAKQDLEMDYANSIEPAKTTDTSSNIKEKIIGTMFVVVLVPLISFITYQEIKPEAPTFTTTPSATSQEQPSIEEMVAKLKTRLGENPNDLDGWIMLARSYDFMGKKADAITAYREALKIAPNDSWVLAQLGHAISEQTNNLEGEPVKLLKKALELAPNNMDARFLIGKYHFQKGEFKQAADNWEYLLGIVNAKDAVPVRKALNAARAELGLAPLVAESKTASTGFIELTVDIAPKIKTKVPVDTVVFIFARAKTGPKMPLAARKTTVGSLPQTIKLDDSMAMLEDLTLSKNMPVSVMARVSLSGNPVPQKGDFFARIDEVTQLNQKLNLTIDQEVQ